MVVQINAEIPTMGVGLIAAERKRQIETEGYSSFHDDTHCGGELAMAAVCYAAPQKIFVQHDLANAVHYSDPFPWSESDKRFQVEEGDGGNVLPDPSHYTDEERIDLLVKAGALIAAEIDRCIRQTKKTEEILGRGSR